MMATYCHRFYLSLCHSRLHSTHKAYKSPKLGSLSLGWIPWANPRWDSPWPTELRGPVSSLPPDQTLRSIQISLIHNMRNLLTETEIIAEEAYRRALQIALAERNDGMFQRPSTDTLVLKWKTRPATSVIVNQWVCCNVGSCDDGSNQCH